MSLLDTASLIVTPNGYKEGKLYSVIPSDGSGDMSVVRATTATRVNSAGLVELVPYNLLTYSNTFSNAAWTKTNTSVTSGQSGYDGSTNAWKLQATATNNCEVDQSFTESETKVFSIYAKAGNVNFVVISVFGAGFGWYNLSNGTLGSSGGTFVSRNIESVGNGWYRCSIVTNVVASGVAVYVADANNSIATTIGSNIFIQDSQLESGSVPTTYQKTETRLNIPRLDYSNGTCPSLLVEPQRTNLFTYSSSFDNAAWTKANATITSNSIISPSGVQDADTITDNSTSGVHVVYQFTGTQLIGTSWSCYMKKGTLDYGYISAVQSSTLFTTCVINLTNGAIHELQNGSSTTGTVTTEDCGNGWYRVKMQTNANNAGYAVGTSNGSALSGTYKEAIYAGTGSGNIYIWGAQLEDASYPTSYIPTTSASVTRNADVISKTGISSLIGQTEGTLFLDFIAPDGTAPILINLATSNQTYLESIYLEYDPANSGLSSRIWTNGSLVGGVTANGIIKGNRYKVALAYKANDTSMYIDGSAITGMIQPNAIQANLSQLYLGNLAGLTGSATFTGLIGNATALWQTRLTNDELATLTTI